MVGGAGDAGWAILSYISSLSHHHHHCSPGASSSQPFKLQVPTWPPVKYYRVVTDSNRLDLLDHGTFPAFSSPSYPNLTPMSLHVPRTVQ